MAFGLFVKEGTQPPAVGYGSIEVPVRRRGTKHLECFANPVQGWQGFLDFMIGAVQAGHVADTSVAPANENPSGKGAFNRDQQIVTIYGHRATCQSGQLQSVLSSPVQRRLRTRRPLERGALAHVKLVVVADELDRGLFRVASGVKIGKVGYTLAQARQPFLAEERGVLRMLAPVVLFARHAFRRCPGVARRAQPGQEALLKV